MSVHHVGLSAGSDSFQKMRDFYLATLGPIGYTVFKEQDNVYCGLQAPTGSPDFWLHFSGATAAEKVQHGAHVAFGVKSRKQVDEWFERAVFVSQGCSLRKQKMLTQFWLLERLEGLPTARLESERT